MIPKLNVLNVIHHRDTKENLNMSEKKTRDANTKMIEMV